MTFHLRVAWRSLWRSPGFTVVAVFTLMLGIGAVSSLFSVVNSVLLRPLAGVDTESLVRLSEKVPAVGGFARVRTYREWRKLTNIFDEVGGRQYCNPNLTRVGEPEQLKAPCVTASWFGVQRAQAILGRTFLPDEDQLGNEQVVVLDYGFWTRRFGRDPRAVGRVITLDLKPYTIIGVMPEGFLPFGKGNADLYLPWVLAANELTSVEVTARLKPGVSIEQARVALDVVEARLASAAPDDYKDVRPQVQLLRETVVGPQRDLLRLLLAASGLVLLVACANVANLFLARGAAKRRETEIRAFLGASRRQLVTPALAESAIVSILGGGLGLLAAWGIARVLAVQLDSFPRGEEIRVDFRVALVTLAIAVLTVFVCGIVPAFSRQRFRAGVLVVAEVALTFVLLICSGLLLRSFVAMRQVDLGYEPRGVILGFISQPADAQDKRDVAVGLWRRVRESIARLPGVDSVATTTGTPTGGVVFGLPVIREEEAVRKPSTSNQPDAHVLIVSGEYFRVAGIRVRSGRTFTERDTGNAPGVVIISQSVADRYFDGAALGRRIQVPTFGFNITSVGAVSLREIVGVVADVKQTSVQEAGRMTLYLPEGQNAVRYTHVIARASSGDPMRLERTIRHAVFEEAPGLAVAPMLTLEQGNAYLTRAPQRAMWLLALFAAVALALASVGVHGVVAYATTQRAREMGIRMALGARPAQLFGLVTRQALRLAAAGAAMGVVIAYIATRLLETLLFGVGRADPATYLTGVLLLVAVAMAASFTPALRAAHTDPSVTLRAE